MVGVRLGAGVVLGLNVGNRVGSEVGANVGGVEIEGETVGVKLHDGAPVGGIVGAGDGVLVAIFSLLSIKLSRSFLEGAYFAQPRPFVGATY